jgi:serine/threonine-protein kinase RsbW
MPESPNVRLSLPNRPENVLVVRQALTGLAVALKLDAIETNDLNTAVTEACNNVVMHAYGDQEGPLEVEVYVLASAIAVVVRDRGIGMRVPAGASEIAGAGMGLAVIGALARRVDFAQPADGGTEVRMEFALPRGVTLEPVGDDNDEQAGLDGPLTAELSSTVEVRLAPSPLARAILPRVLSALAARAHFSMDRISDVQLIADALAANADQSFDGSHLAVGVTIAPRNLELRVGPLQAGRGESLVVAAADGLAPVIDRLTDAKRVAATGSGETLELHMVDERGA